MTIFGKPVRDKPGNHTRSRPVSKRFFLRLKFSCDSMTTHRAGLKASKHSREIPAVFFPLYSLFHSSNGAEPIKLLSERMRLDESVLDSGVAGAISYPFDCYGDSEPYYWRCGSRAENG